MSTRVCLYSCSLLTLSPTAAAASPCAGGYNQPEYSLVVTLRFIGGLDFVNESSKVEWEDKGSEWDVKSFQSVYQPSASVSTSTSQTLNYCIILYLTYLLVDNSYSAFGCIARKKLPKLFRSHPKNSHSKFRINKQPSEI